MLQDGICIDRDEKVAVESPDGSYWFPFLVFSCLWIIFALILKHSCKKKRNIGFIQLAIPGVALFSLLLAIVDGASVYQDKGAPTEGVAVLIIGIVLRLVILQVAFILFRIFSLNRDELFQDFRANFKGSTLIMTSLAFGIDVRFFKLIYSNMAGRLNLRTLNDEDDSIGKRPKRLYMILSMLAIPFDLSLIFIAVSLLAQPDVATRLMQVSLERVLISLFLIASTILEYFMPGRNCCRRDKSKTVAPQEGPVFKDKNNNHPYRVLSASMLTDVADQTANRTVTLPQEDVEDKPIVSNRHRKQFDINGR